MTNYQSAKKEQKDSRSVDVENSKKNPLMSAWKSHWTGLKKASPHKYVEKGLVDHVRRYHMVHLASLAHKLLKTPWVNRIPIFMELKG